jgi:hypothetical protein
MAQASKRSAFLRPVMYDDDDEPSSISMSLELFGYHNGGVGVVVDDGDEAADGGSASALSLQLAFDDDSFVKGGCECDDAGGGGASAADYYYYGSWAGAYGGSGATSSGSNSSVLSFEQAGSGGGQRHHLVYGEDGCALWMDDAGAGMVVEHPPAQQQQQHGSGCDFGLIGSSPDDAGLPIQLEPGTVQLPAKAPPHKRARRVRN